MSRSEKHDLQDRLIKFAVLIVKTVKGLPSDKVGNHLGGQLLRSGTSPALNYGEAQSVESRNDFVHKLKVILKELRETLICLRILVEIDSVKADNPACKECDELIAIFVKSVITANRNSEA